jgi:hypothetical protein
VGGEGEYKGKDRWAQDNERNAERAAKGEAGEGVEGKDDKVRPRGMLGEEGTVKKDKT